MDSNNLIFTTTILNEYYDVVTDDRFGEEYQYLDELYKVDDEDTLTSNNNYNRAYNKTYSEFEGSYAQDYMGYSDETIDDAFEGDPDLYWNID